MNKKRRGILHSLIFEMNLAAITVEEARDILQDLIDDEQDALDNTPESLAESDRYQRYADALDLMQEAESELDDEDEESLKAAAAVLEQIDL